MSVWELTAIEATVHGVPGESNATGSHWVTKGRQLGQHCVFGPFSVSAIPQTLGLMSGGGRSMAGCGAGSATRATASGSIALGQFTGRGSPGASGPGIEAERKGRPS